jgi:predicted nucleotide-binding protein
MARGKSQGGRPPRGNPTVSPEVGIELLSERIRKATDLLANQPIGGDVFHSWDNTARNTVERAFGENHPNVQNFEYYWAFGNTNWSVAEWAQHYAKGLQAKITLLSGYLEELKMEIRIQQPSATLQSKASPEFSSKIFIVHGHDGELKEATARLVAQVGLEPIILHEQTNRGRTIIEKFADHAGEAGFAIVLLSADDVGRRKEPPPQHKQNSSPPNPFQHIFEPTVREEPTSLRLRARQNVVFELGFFFGWLGRKRVCAVYEKGVELPSDLQGIVYVEYDQGGKWKYDVAREIRDAGYEVDLNKV